MAPTTIRKRMRLGKDSTQPPVNLETLFARTRLDCNPRAMDSADALGIIGAEARPIMKRSSCWSGNASERFARKCARGDAIKFRRRAPKSEMRFAILVLGANFVAHDQRRLRQREDQRQRQYAENLEIHPVVGRQNAAQDFIEPSQREKEQAPA